MATYRIAFALVTPVAGGTHHPDVQTVEAPSYDLAAARLLNDLEDEITAEQVWAAYVITRTGARLWAINGAIAGDEDE